MISNRTRRNISKKIDTKCFLLVESPSLCLQHHQHLDEHGLPWDCRLLLWQHRQAGVHTQPQFLFDPKCTSAAC